MFSICLRNARCISNIRFLRPGVAAVFVLPSTQRQTSSSHHFYATLTSASQRNIKSVAVLGGGITGLSAAWYLSKFAPNVPVTLYEKSTRLGGWLNSKRVEYEGGSVLFEEGPRTLRPWSIAGLVTIDLIRQLNLVDDILVIPKSSPAAKNRFIYYPDTLNQLPNDLVSALVSAFKLPVMKGAFSAVIAEPFRKRRDPPIVDESVGSFVSRRLSPDIANNLVSAMLHGIYAGDVSELSMRSIFPSQYHTEKVNGSLLRGAFSRKMMEKYEDALLRDQLYKVNLPAMKKIESASVYSFKGGIETLSSALVKELESLPNVTIKNSTRITGIKYNDNQFDIETEKSPESHSHVISTLFAPTLNNLLEDHLRISSFRVMYASTVQVVNLYFRSPSLHGVSGFGYLLPKSLTKAANPHYALGVIFDSDATPSPDEPGTKLTVMMGGHYWRGIPNYPNPEMAVSNALDVVKTHLKITEKPVATNVALNKDCIPQYTVGHEERMRQAHKELQRGFDGRLSVAGSSYRGVGLNDCVRHARSTVMGMVQGAREVGFTGLEGMANERWVEVGKPLPLEN